MAFVKIKGPGGMTKIKKKQRQTTLEGGNFLQQKMISERLNCQGGEPFGGTYSPKKREEGRLSEPSFRTTKKVLRPFSSSLALYQRGRNERGSGWTGVFFLGEIA